MDGRCPRPSVSTRGLALAPSPAGCGTWESVLRCSSSPTCSASLLHLCTPCTPHAHAPAHTHREGVEEAGQVDAAQAPLVGLHLPQHLAQFLRGSRIRCPKKVYVFYAKPGGLGAYFLKLFGPRTRPTRSVIFIFHWHPFYKLIDAFWIHLGPNLMLAQLENQVWAKTSD